MDRILIEEDLDALRRATNRWAVLLAWHRAGLLDALADGRARRLDELPGDRRAISITAPILAHAGLLVRHAGPEGEAWSLSGAGRRLHAEGALALDHGWDVLGDLGRLDAVLREGGPVRGPDGASRVTRGGVREDDPEGSRRFLARLERRSGASAVETARAIVARVPGGAALDLGGGHGRYARELADRGFRATLFDFPMVVEIARERHGEALAYRGGDFHVDDLGGPWDVVLLSNIVHNLSDAELDAILPRLRASLRPGGIVVLKDMFVDDSGVGPEIPVAFGLVMLCYTAGGRAYATRDVEARLRRAGFQGVDVVAVTDQGFQLVIAE
jgi:2-polyprenyl-3-methyl-5-hydroxy-6-metoxy-1,4-benzoquinol methylase